MAGGGASDKNGYGHYEPSDENGHLQKSQKIHRSTHIYTVSLKEHKTRGKNVTTMLVLPFPTLKRG